MSAYRLLYERYEKAMFNTALRITGNRVDAEDVLQDAFIDAFSRLRSFEGRSTFGAWLRQIVVYKSIGLLKKRKVNFIDPTSGQWDLIPEETIDETGVEYTVAGIKAAIADLPDGYRAVLCLYLLEGYDQEEIAEILKVSHSTVRSQYLRGKQKLLQKLKKVKTHE